MKNKWELEEETKYELKTIFQSLGPETRGDLKNVSYSECIGILKKNHNSQNIT